MCSDHFFFILFISSLINSLFILPLTLVSHIVHIHLSFLPSFLCYSLSLFIFLILSLTLPFSLSLFHRSSLLLFLFFFLIISFFISLTFPTFCVSLLFPPLLTTSIELKKKWRISITIIHNCWNRIVFLISVW